jgi:hypothetical protein
MQNYSETSQFFQNLKFELIWVEFNINVGYDKDGKTYTCGILDPRAFSNRLVGPQ